MKPKPYLHGDRTVFGVMPDWNPAEIIGVRPRPLALSLYRELITDSIWAYQRHNYGYKNLRSFPLLIDFHGLPYIDVRVSFNSFVPADIEDDLADRLVNHYIDRLVAAPVLHDKIEFEIVLSCYSFDLPERLAQLPADVFSDDDRDTIAASLRRLTNRIINNRTSVCGGTMPTASRSCSDGGRHGDGRRPRHRVAHLLAARGLQALRHAAVRRAGAGRLHRHADAALAGHRRRVDRRRAARAS